MSAGIIWVRNLAEVVLDDGVGIPSRRLANIRTSSCMRGAILKEYTCVDKGILVVGEDSKAPAKCAHHEVE